MLIFCHYFYFDFLHLFSPSFVFVIIFLRFRFHLFRRFSLRYFDCYLLVDVSLFCWLLYLPLIYWLFLYLALIRCHYFSSDIIFATSCWYLFIIAIFIISLRYYLLIILFRFDIDLFRCHDSFRCCCQALLSPLFSVLRWLCFSLLLPLSVVAIISLFFRHWYWWRISFSLSHYYYYLLITLLHFIIFIFDIFASALSLSLFFIFFHYFHDCRFHALANIIRFSFSDWWFHFRYYFHYYYCWLFSFYFAGFHIIIIDTYILVLLPFISLHWLFRRHFHYAVLYWYLYFHFLIFSLFLSLALLPRLWVRHAVATAIDYFA